MVWTHLCIPCQWNPRLRFSCWRRSCSWFWWWRSCHRCIERRIWSRRQFPPCRLAGMTSPESPLCCWRSLDVHNVHLTRNKKYKSVKWSWWKTNKNNVFGPRGWKRTNLVATSSLSLSLSRRHCRPCPPPQKKLSCHLTMELSLFVYNCGTYLFCVQIFNTTPEFGDDNIQQSWHLSWWMCIK